MSPFSYSFAGMPGPEATLADWLRWSVDDGPKHFRPIAYACLTTTRALPLCRRPKPGSRPSRIARTSCFWAMTSSRLWAPILPLKIAAPVHPDRALPGDHLVRAPGRAYAMAALPTALGFNTLLVESRPKHERDLGRSHMGPQPRRQHGDRQGRGGRLMGANPSLRRRAACSDRRHQGRDPRQRGNGPRRSWHRLAPRNRRPSDDLPALPETRSLAVGPEGQVWCRCLLQLLRAASLRQHFRHRHEGQRPDGR